MIIKYTSRELFNLNRALPGCVPTSVTVHLVLQTRLLLIRCPLYLNAVCLKLISNHPVPGLL
jgi:hypothetical protein